MDSFQYKELNWLRFESSCVVACDIVYIAYIHTPTLTMIATAPQTESFSLRVKESMPRIIPPMGKKRPTMMPSGPRRFPVPAEFAPLLEAGRPSCPSLTHGSSD